MTVLFANEFKVLLNAPCGSTDTSIHTTGAAPAELQSGQFYIRVAVEGQPTHEYMLVTAGQDTTTWTVTRGVDGSTAISHQAFEEIVQVVPAAVLRSMLAAAGVSSFNTRTGAVTLSKADVTGTGLAAADVSADASGAAAAAQAASIPLAQKGAASGVATLDAGSLLPTAQLPPLALTDPYVVASQAAQLALSAHIGDFAIRTDTGKTYVHNSGTAGTMADWTEITATGAVVSVNGHVGTVSLTASDVGADGAGAAAAAQTAAIAASAQGLTPTAAKTGTYTAAVGDFVPVDVSGSGFTVTLPTAPADKTRIGIKIVANASTPNTLTIARGGTDVFNVAGGSTSLLLTAKFQGVILQYQASSGVWYVQSLDSATGNPGGAASLGTDGKHKSSEIPSSVASAISQFAAGQLALASTSYIDLCTAWNNGSGPIAAVSPATPLTVTFNGSTTASVTAGVAPASGAILADALPIGTTFTASGSTLTLSQAATASGSAPAWAGVDCTAALQAAVNYFNAQNIDGTVECSQPGVYLINGGLQSGTAQGRAYNGQILMPARALTASVGMITIRIKGPQPIAGFPGNGVLDPSGGVTFLFATGSGSGVDSIGGNSFGAALTAITVVWEDVRVTSVRLNPQLNALIDGTGFGGMICRGSVLVDTIVPGAPSSLTGTGYGIIWPQAGNMAMLRQIGNLAICGFPNGQKDGEHLVADSVFIQRAVTAHVAAAAGGHPVIINHLCVQGCNYVFAPLSGVPHLKALVDIGDGTPFLTGLFNDPSDTIYGNIEVAPTLYSASEVPGLGFPTRGGRNVSIRPHLRPPSVWPSDTFTRIGTFPQTWAFGPGATDRTNHIWMPTGGAAIFPSNGTMTSGVSGGQFSSLLKYIVGRNNPSRVVRLVLTPTGSYNAFVLVGWVVSGTNTNHGLVVQLNGGNLNLKRGTIISNTTLATASSVVSTGTQYTVDVEVSNPYSVAGLATITVFLNGTQEISYTLNSTDYAALSDTEQFYTQDGLGTFADQNTTMTEFAVMPIA